jgi:hypothetical protein
MALDQSHPLTHPAFEGAGERGRFCTAGAGRSSSKCDLCKQLTLALESLAFVLTEIGDEFEENAVSGALC